MMDDKCARQQFGNEIRSRFREHGRQLTLQHLLQLIGPDSVKPSFWEAFSYMIREGEIRFTGRNGDGEAMLTSRQENVDQGGWYSVKMYPGQHASSFTTFIPPLPDRAIGGILFNMYDQDDCNEKIAVRMIAEYPEIRFLVNNDAGVRQYDRIIAQLAFQILLKKVRELEAEGAGVGFVL